MLPTSQRFQFFDSVRGFALILMTIYYFCWDLNYFGVLNYEMDQNPFWVAFRAAVLSMFLLLVGMNFTFSGAHFDNIKYRIRLKKLGICAFVVSFITFLMNRETWIYFGILHLAFCASLIAPFLIHHPKTAAAIGLIISAIPNFYSSLWFDKPVRNIAGLSPYRPSTEDFVPLMPWLGVVLIGIAAGHWVLKRQKTFAQKKDIPALSRLGRHSLIFYMTHQLILFPIAWVVSRFILD
ncbi:MAG: heparan-alpha-glucosaminide N-acetyltransferase [Pseudobdellovibrionaceae bacterium]